MNLGFRPPERVDQYRICERLGRGGMGVVYRAEHEKLGRQAAIKFICLQAEDDSIAQKRFLREANIIAQLDHPAIVKIYDARSWEQGEAIIMELVTGENLGELLRREGRLPWQKAVPLFREITRGLEHAHREGFIHRDLKPSNIMVTANGQPKILDFGLAKLVDEASTLTREGGVVGTPAYMSPEQAYAKDLDVRSDLFSLGALFYECLTGESPFRGKKAIENVRRHYPLSVCELVPKVPRALSELVERMLDKAPENRPHSAGDVLAGLDRLDMATVGPRSEPGDSAPTFDDRVAEVEAQVPSKHLGCRRYWKLLTFGPLLVLLVRRYWKFLAAGAVCAALIVYGLTSNLEASLQRVRAQIDTGEIASALAGLDTLENRGVDDPRIELLRAHAWYVRGDFTRSKEIAAAAATDADAASMPIVLAEARLLEATALFDLGQRKQAQRTGREAQQIFETASKPLGVARVRELLAFDLYEHGDLTRAEEEFWALDRIYEDLGDHRLAANARGTLGQILADQDRFDEAKELLIREVAKLEKLGAHEAANFILDLGILEHQRGNPNAALARYKEAQDEYEKRGDTAGQAVALTNLGEAAYLRGELGRARDLHLQARGINRQNEEPYGFAYDTFRLGRIYLAQDELTKSREALEAAFAQEAVLGDQVEAEIQMAFAELELAEGRPAAATGLARTAVEILDERSAWNLATRARAVLSRALLAAGKLEEARAVSAAALAAAMGSQDLRAQLAAEIAAARILTAEGVGSPAAVTNLLALANDAAGRGLLIDSLEARLAAAELERNFDAETASGRLRALAEEAAQQGYRWIQRQALAALDN